MHSSISNINNCRIFLVILIITLLCVLSTIVFAEKVTFVVSSQGSNISEKSSAIITTTDYQYLTVFNGDSNGLSGDLDPGNYIAVVKLNKQSMVPIFPVKIEFRVDSGQVCSVEVELKGMENSMEMANQVMELEEFILQVEDLPPNINIMPYDDLGMDMDDSYKYDELEDDMTIEESETSDYDMVKFEITSELVVTVKRGKVQVYYDTIDPFFREQLAEMGYSYAGDGCIINQGESKKFANLTIIEPY